MGARPFNVRMDDDLRQAIRAQAEADGMPDASAWAREAMAGTIRLGGLKKLADAIDDELHPSAVPDPHPVRATQRIAAPTIRDTTSQSCLHPRHARTRLPFSTVCTICGATITRTTL